MAFQPNEEMDYYISAKKNDFVLDAHMNPGSPLLGASVTQQTYAGKSNQKFRFEKNKEDDSFVIIFKEGGYYALTAAGTNEGDSVTARLPDPDPSQYFIIEELEEDGYFKIISKESNLVFEVGGGGLDIGDPIILNKWSDDNEQKFEILPAYIEHSGVKGILQEQLGDKLKDDWSFNALGEVYCITPLKRGEEIVNNSDVDRYIKDENRFDSEDFALLLKADFIKAAYKDKVSYPYCMGMVWGDLKGAPAINWMINEDLQVRFIETENDIISLPRPEDKDISFIYC
ncbi:MAG: RICIN domain-containing protein [Ignavibacteria bacterium]|jgi:hypothetical protein